VEEVSKEAGLAGVRILDPEGKVLADSNPEAVGRRVTPPVPLAPLLDSPQAKGWKEGDLYIVAKRFIPLSSGSGMMMHSPWRGRLWGRRAPPRVAFVEMYLHPYMEAQREDIRHAFLMGLILLVLGSASFYFIFVVQNLQLVRRTLRGMTTYIGHVVEHMPDGLISVSPTGEVVRINNQARRLLRLEEPLEGKEIEELGDPLGGIFRAIRDEVPFLEKEVELPQPSGDTIPVALSASRVQGDRGEDLGVVILLKDLREIRALQQRVQRSERLAALGQLAAGVAHEIRNPLSSIRGFAQYFQRSFQEGTEHHRYAGVMIQEVDRLNRVISNLLDFARPKDPVLRKVDPKEVVAHAATLVQREAKDRGVEVVIEGEAPPCPLDRDQMTQALLNLLINSLEAMESGGTLTVRLGEDSQDSSWFIEVRDSGPGIPPQDLPRLFDPFFTTKKRGTGLGLAIVHRIVENHGGTIEATNIPQGGARFVLRFPRKD